MTTLTAGVADWLSVRLFWPLLAVP
jgi:hypothetical protein